MVGLGEAGAIGYANEKEIVIGNKTNKSLEFFISQSHLFKKGALQMEKKLQSAKNHQMKKTQIKSSWKIFHLFPVQKVQVCVIIIKMAFERTTGRSVNM